MNFVRELGYARAAAEVIRRERAGLMLKKDRGPGGQRRHRPNSCLTGGGD